MRRAWAEGPTRSPATHVSRRTWYDGVTVLVLWTGTDHVATQRTEMERRHGGQTQMERRHGERGEGGED